VTLIGYMHHRSDPIKVRHAYAFAAVASAEGLDFIYFTPGKIDTEKQTVQGWVYQNGHWMEKTTRFPEAVYNEALQSEKHWPKIQNMRRKVPFTSHAIGDKMSVYERLKRGGKFNANLIPSKELLNVEDDLKEFLVTFGSVVVKPLWGAKGVGVLQLQRLDDDSVQVLENGQRTEYSFAACSEFIRALNDQNPCLVQQYVACMTTDGQPFDFRVHVQKDGTGKWVCSALYQRVACPGNITSNLSSGGHTGYFDVFLQRQFGQEWFNVKSYLRQFGVQLASHMEAMYHERFDELGIDVGIDAQKKAMIYEVNWKPGPPPIWLMEMDVIKNTVLYTSYLAKQNKGNAAHEL